MSAMFAVLRRDLTLAMQRPGDTLQPLWFLLLVITLFPLAIGPEPERLAELASAVIWISALLATLLALDGLFRRDFDDGGLEQWLLVDTPLPLLVFGRVLSHWLITGLPMVLLSPLLALLLNLPGEALPVLVKSLLLGTPVLSLLGAVAASLSIGSRRGGMLLTLLVAPLYLPVLIFATGAVQNSILGLPVTAPLTMLAAILVLTLTLTPFAIAGALRVTLDA